MMISNALLAETGELPPIGDVLYQYVIAANGLFIRAEDSRLAALINLAPVRLTGLADLTPGLTLKVPRVPVVWLFAILKSARQHLPREAMYQLTFDERGWRVAMPAQVGTPTALRFADNSAAVIDLHSHNSMAAFFSDTDDRDEQGFRLYAVIGRIDTPQPEIRVRVGVYGHHMAVPAELVFDGLGPFVEQVAEEAEAAAVAEFERQLSALDA